MEQQDPPVTNYPEPPLETPAEPQPVQVSYIVPHDILIIREAVKRSPPVEIIHEEHDIVGLGFSQMNSSSRMKVSPGIIISFGNQQQDFIRTIAGLTQPGLVIHLMPAVKTEYQRYMKTEHFYAQRKIKPINLHNMVAQVLPFELHGEAVVYSSKFKPAAILFEEDLRFPMESKERERQGAQWHLTHRTIWYQGIKIMILDTLYMAMKPFHLEDYQTKLLDSEADLVIQEFPKADHGKPKALEDLAQAVNKDWDIFNVVINDYDYLIFRKRDGDANAVNLISSEFHMTLLIKIQPKYYDFTVNYPTIFTQMLINRVSRVNQDPDDQSDEDYVISILKRIPNETAYSYKGVSPNHPFLKAMRPEVIQILTSADHEARNKFIEERKTEAEEKGKTKIIATLEESANDLKKYYLPADYKKDSNSAYQGISFALDYNYKPHFGTQAESILASDFQSRSAKTEGTTEAPPDITELVDTKIHQTDEEVHKQAIDIMRVAKQARLSKAGSMDGIYFDAIILSCPHSANWLKMNEEEMQEQIDKCQKCTHILSITKAFISNKVLNATDKENTPIALPLFRMKPVYLPKNLNEPMSCRLITICSHLMKLIEAAAVQEMKPLLDGLPLAITQHHSAEYLPPVAKIRVLAHLNPKLSIITKMDIKSAFDNVDRDNIYRWIDNACPVMGPLLKFFIKKQVLSVYGIANELQTRDQQVRTFTIADYIINRGIRQGGPSSPALFTLAMASALKQFPNQQNLVIYVDDITLLSETQIYAESERALIAQLLRTIGLELVPEKTQEMLICRNDSYDSNSPSAIKILGFELDRTLSFNHGVESAWIQAASKQKAFRAAVKDVHMNLKYFLDSTLVAFVSKIRVAFVPSWIEDQRSFAQAIKELFRTCLDIKPEVPLPLELIIPIVDPELYWTKAILKTRDIADSKADRAELPDPVTIEAIEKEGILGVNTWIATLHGNKQKLKLNRTKIKAMLRYLASINQYQPTLDKATLKACKFEEDFVKEDFKVPHYLYHLENYFDEDSEAKVHKRLPDFDFKTKLLIPEPVQGLMVNQLDTNTRNFAIKSQSLAKHRRQPWDTPHLPTLAANLLNKHNLVDNVEAQQITIKSLELVNSISNIINDLNFYNVTKADAKETTTQAYVKFFLETRINYEMIASIIQQNQLSPDRISTIVRDLTTTSNFNMNPAILTSVQRAAQKEEEEEEECEQHHRDPLRTMPEAPKDKKVSKAIDELKDTKPSSPEDKPLKSIIDNLENLSQTQTEKLMKLILSKAKTPEQSTTGEPTVIKASRPATKPQPQAQPQEYKKPVSRPTKERRTGISSSEEEISEKIVPETLNSKTETYTSRNIEDSWRRSINMSEDEEFEREPSTDKPTKKLVKGANETADVKKSSSPTGPSQAQSKGHQVSTMPPLAGLKALIAKNAKSLQSKEDEEKSARYSKGLSSRTKTNANEKKQ